ncbi:MAG: ABC transporter permease, partial [Bacteroidota bacterium]
EKGQAFFFKLMGFFSFCLFLGILIKRSAFALGFLILWAILEQVFFGLLGWKVMSWEAAQRVKNFFPLEATANLIKEPFSRLSAVQNIGEQIGESMNFDYHVYWYEFLIVILWTLIFVYLSHALLKKRDL